MALDFVQGAALMLALCWLLSISARYWRERLLLSRVASGLIFGSICAVGMLTPVVLSPGVFLDTRTDVIALAALFGGPLTGTITFVIVAALRWWLGGAGMWAGIASAGVPLLLGLALRAAVEKNLLKHGPREFLALGFLVHCSGLLFFTTLQPSGQLPSIEIVLLFLGARPVVTLLLGLLLKEVEGRTIMIAALQQSEGRLRAIASALPDTLHVIDEDGRYLDVVSTGHGPMHGHVSAAQNWVGRRMTEVLSPDYVDLFKGLLERALRSSMPQSLEYAMPALDSDGPRTFEVRAKRLERLSEGKQAAVFVTRDITLRRKAEEQIRTLALYDALTGLPNRSFMLARMPLARSQSAHSQTFAALLSIDLDDFGALNDTHGNLAGDRMLQRVAQCLQAILPAGAMLARWGADEFVVLLEGLPPQEEEAAADAARIAHTAIDEIVRTATDDVLSHMASASIGIALFRDTDASDNPMRRATLALYEAKTAGKGQIRIYDPAIQEAIVARRALEAEIRRALMRHELVIHYQPQLNNAARITGVEALVRWHHPERGLLYPAYFLAAAERAGLMYELDTQVLTGACAQLERWSHELALRDLVISVNISAFQMSRHAFASEVMAVVKQTGANACRLKLELTETALVNDMTLAKSHMVALRALGVRFALDDFGTGYSSMSYLQRLPLDQLKIDQSFVKGLPEDKGSLAIVRAIVALAANFEFEVLAEGVETQAQRDLLEAHGCHHYQGYLFSRALPVAELERMMKRFPVA